MPPDVHALAADRYVAAILSTAARILGREIPVGTTVVAAPDRNGSTTAVAYPLAERTVVWCSEQVRPTIDSLAGPEPLGADDFVHASEQLGGVYVGSGHHRVLRVRAPAATVDSSRLLVLDRDDAADRALIGTFVDACPDSDLDEAELDMDVLDEAIVAVTDPAGSIASYASARPWSFDPGFDDVAVITHPDHRGRRLGVEAVTWLSRRQQASGRMMFYNCNADNLGSNRVAELAGFDRVTTVAAMGFG